jgi:putative ABC transport system permease protein
VIGAGLLVKSAAQLLQVDPGFNPRSLLTMTISLPNNKFEWKHNVAFSREVIATVQSLAPVRGAAVVQGLPMRTGSFWGPFEAESGAALASGEPPVARIRVVSPGYFGVMEIPILSGRDFSERDEAGEVDGLTAPTLRHVVINQALVSRYWPGEDGVGKRIRGDGGTAWMEVIGVVGDVRYAGIDEGPRFDVYFPEGLFPQAAITLLVRANGDPLNLVADIRSRIGQIDQEAFVNDIRPMDALIADSLAPRRLSTMLVIAFAGIAVILSLIGISSSIAQSIGQRKLEIGIRMAVGAQPSAVMALVLSRTVALTGLGTVVGLAGAVSVSRFLEGLLYGLTPLDAPTYFATSLLFTFVAAAMSYVQARRATRIDPSIALRSE